MTAEWMTYVFCRFLMKPYFAFYCAGKMGEKLFSEALETMSLNVNNLVPRISSRIIIMA